MKQKSKRKVKGRNTSAAPKQLLQPPEFRIASPIWPPDDEEAISRLVEAIQTRGKETPSKPAALVDDKELTRMLADVCTGLCRLRQKMLQPGTDRPFEEMRKVFRYFEAVWDALKQGGIEIRDHTGDPYNDGSGLDVAAFEPRAGIGRETIVDCIKPTILLKGRLLQVGQIIVGTPEKKGENHGPQHD